MSDKKSKLIIAEDVCEDGVLAHRNKASIEVFFSTKQVGFNDFSYSWEDIITVGRKLEELHRKSLADVL